ARFSTSTPNFTIGGEILTCYLGQTCLIFPKIFYSNWFCWVIITQNFQILTESPSALGELFGELIGESSDEFSWHTFGYRLQQVRSNIKSLFLTLKRSPPCS